MDRRVRFSTFGLFMLFLVGSLNIFALLAEFDAQAKGWKVQAMREGEGVVFEVRVPVAAGGQRATPGRRGARRGRHRAADTADTRASTSGKSSCRGALEVRAPR